jgi:tetraprenyl-beta-curcumene synthase
MTRPARSSALAARPSPPSRVQGARPSPQPPAQPISRGLALAAALALGRIKLRYWLSVAPIVRAELRRWHECARAIEDPVLRALALAKLEQEGFNAEAAAMLATLAPRRRRRHAVAAIVAIELLYDYLDGLTESLAGEPTQDGRQLFRAFTDAVTPALAPRGDYYRHHSRHEDAYLQPLVTSARRAIRRLPATGTLSVLLRRSAARGAQAQLHIHAGAGSSPAVAQRWAERQAAGTSLGWRELLAGAACSVLTVHALIAAAGDRRTTYAQGLEIEQLYKLVSVLPTLLDSVVDHDEDTRDRHPSYVDRYESQEILAERLAAVSADALARARVAPHGADHVMVLVGVVAYYASAPGADSDFARPLIRDVCRQLRPLVRPTLAIMHAWRMLKRIRRHERPPVSALPSI